MHTPTHAAEERVLALLEAAELEPKRLVRQELLLKALCHALLCVAAATIEQPRTRGLDY